MKIALVNPPSPFLLDDRVFAPLGILQVAAVLEEAGHTVYVIDLGGVSAYKDKMIQEIRLGPWDIYGITATTPQFPMAVDLLQVIRDEDPGKRVMIGGPHSTVLPESCKMFDCVIRGDGEEAVLDALRSDAPPVLDKSSAQKGELKWHWPARHLIDLDSYQYKLGGRKGTSVMLSQGCPYGCLFCCGRTLPYYRRQRQRNVDDVVREMEFLVDQYGIGAVMAFDDEVNIQNAPLIEFCEKIAPLGLKFRGFVKANLFNDGQAEAMAKAGFVDVCTGVEAGSDRILGIIEKKTTREINKRFVDLCRSHGMRSKAFCSLGHPGENFESAVQLKDWLLWARPDDFDVTCITVYPGTPLWEERQFVEMDHEKRVVKYVKKSGRPEEHGATLFFEELDYASEFAFYKGRPHEYVSHVWTPDLSKDDLVKLRDEIEDSVRKELGIPYPVRYSGDFLDGVNNFDHSYGMGLSPQDSRVKIRDA